MVQASGPPRRLPHLVMAQRETACMRSGAGFRLAIFRAVRKDHGTRMQISEGSRICGEKRTKERGRERNEGEGR